METQVHYLKTHQNTYLETELGKKSFEIRKNDRDFRGGDYLCLQETREINGTYTENEMLVTVRYVLAGDLAERYGLKDGYCAMSIIKLNSEVQLAIKNQVYPWDEKLGILFSSQQGIMLVEELVKDWVDENWDEVSVQGQSSLLITKQQYKINLIRRAENWYAEENIQRQNISLAERMLAFVSWLGW